MYETRDRSRNWWPWLLVMLFFVAWWAREGLPRLVYGPAPPRTVAPRGDLAGDEISTIDLYEAASPSVVHVSPIERRRVSPFSRATAEFEAGTGSGFIWDEQGHIVTNYHVLAMADRVVVTLFDGTTWNGDLVGVAADKDIAVVRIDAPTYKLRPIPVGTSRDLRVGQKVFAIGNPFGLDFTLTTGVVSALNRDIEALNQRTIHGVIQTDAAINPGNSGGPLLDSAGRLIGVNTAIHSPSGVNSGIGFAVPVDLVNDVVPQIVAHGRVIRPGLGIVIYPEEHPVYARLRIDGVLVRQVIEASGAHSAALSGVRQLNNGNYLGHVIVGIDGQSIDSPVGLLDALEQYEVGDTVKVEFREQVLGTSSYEEFTVDVTLQAIN